MWFCRDLGKMPVRRLASRQLISPSTARSPKLSISTLLVAVQEPQAGMLTLFPGCPIESPDEFSTHPEPLGCPLDGNADGHAFGDCPVHEPQYGLQVTLLVLGHASRSE